MKPLTTFNAPPIPPAYNASNFAPPLPATFDDSANPTQQKLDEISNEMERRNNPAYVAGRLLLDMYNWATRRNMDRDKIYEKFLDASRQLKPEEARKHISRYIKRLDQLSEVYPKLLYDAGHHCRNSGFYPEAIDAFSRAISRLLSLKQTARDPGLSLLKESYRLRADGYVKLGKYEEALQDVEKLIEFEINNRAFVEGERRRLGEFVSRLKLESGIKLRETDLPNSLRLFDEAIERDPKNALAFFERAVAHGLVGRSDKAVADYGKFLELGFTDVDLLRTAISRKAAAGFLRVLDFKEGHKEALRDFRKLIEIDRSPVHIYRRAIIEIVLGRYYAARNDFSKVIELLNEAIELDQKNALAFPEGALAHKELGNNDEAARDSRLSLLKESYQFRAHAYFELGNYKEALQDTEKLIEIDPSVDNIYGMGLLNFHLGNYQKARDDFSRVLERGDHLRSELIQFSYEKRALCNRHLGNRRQSFADIRVAKDLDPHDSDPIQKRKKVDQAVSKERVESGTKLRETDLLKSLHLFNQAIYFDPENVRAFLERSRIHEALGMNDEAAADKVKFSELEWVNLSKIYSELMMIFGSLVTLAIGVVALERHRYLNRNNPIPNPAPLPNPPFRSEDEAEKAIRGFARVLTDQILEKEDLSPAQKESFLALTSKKAEDLFAKVVGIKVGEDLNQKVEEILSGAPENNEMKEMLLEQLRNVQESKKVQTYRLPTGALVEKNFIYDNIIPNGTMHRQLNLEKLTWAFKIFEDEVKKSLVKIHQEVEKDEVGEVLCGLVKKVSAKNLSNRKTEQNNDFSNSI